MSTFSKNILLCLLLVPNITRASGYAISEEGSLKLLAVFGIFILFIFIIPFFISTYFSNKYGGSIGRKAIRIGLSIILTSVILLSSVYISGVIENKIPPLSFMIIFWYFCTICIISTALGSWLARKIIK